MDPSTALVSAPRPSTVLVVGANGYLGSAICGAFLRGASSPSRAFSVYGLVRRESAARLLAQAEVIPILGSMSDRDRVCQAVLSHSPIWDVIVTCTEPSKADAALEAQHWDDVLALVRSLSKESVARGVRPFVMWTSGCKDYGMAGLHGDADLAPHTEESPLRSHPVLRIRTDGALRALEVAGSGGGAAGFDLAVLRPTAVFGYSGSYYATGLEYAAKFAAAADADKTHRDQDAKVPDEGRQSGRVLKFTADARTIMHGLHIDDCAEAYVALAKVALWGAPGPDGSTPVGRLAVTGQAFNISGRRYETLEEVGTALAREYGFDGGAKFGVSAQEVPGAVSGPGNDLFFAWSQWVGSDKIRKLTGWSDKRPLFSENIHVYRLAFEAAAEAKMDEIDKVRRRMAGDWRDN